jgi:membrane protein DedA with SNARE-associated domain
MSTMKRVTCIILTGVAFGSIFELREQASSIWGRALIAALAGAVLGASIAIIRGMSTMPRVTGMILAGVAFGSLFELRGQASSIWGRALIAALAGAVLAAAVAIGSRK